MICCTRSHSQRNKMANEKCASWELSQRRRCEEPLAGPSQAQDDIEEGPAEGRNRTIAEPVQTPHGVTDKPPELATQSKIRHH